MSSTRKENGKLSQMLCVLHTGPVTVEPLGRLFREIAPGVRIVNIIDDSLLRDVMAVGKVTVEVARRMCQYMMVAQDMGADAILNACSSVGEVVEVARDLISIPIVRIDEAMAETAVKIGQTIGVVATVETTLNPTVRLITNKAAEAGKKVTVKRALCSEAFEALVSGDPEMHDRLLTGSVEGVAKAVDVIVLAQVSMARLAPSLDKRVGVPVLSSPRSGVAYAKQVLDALPS